MNQKIWVNKGGRYWGGPSSMILDEFAAAKGGRHVVDCAWFSGIEGARWTEFPVSIYYAGYRPESGFDNRYFGLVPMRRGVVKIFDADRVEEMRFFALVNRGGEAIFSRWRRDYRTFSCGGPHVGGGLDYWRCVGHFKGCRQAFLAVRDGQFMEIT